VIGCGRAGCGFDDLDNKVVRTHAGSYYKNSKSDLIAFCDIDKKKLKKYGRKYHVSGLYTNVVEMLENEELDCISICTLADTHLELIKEISKFKIKGVLIEKPISNSLLNAKKIIDVCKKHEIILAINHQRRFDPAYYYIQKFLQKKNLGDIQIINLYYGRGITNTGSHLFDLLRLLFGEIKSVTGIFSKNKSINLLDPNIDATLHFQNNLTCSLQSLDAKYFTMAELDIIGQKGRIQIDFVANQGTLFCLPKTKFLDTKKLTKSSNFTKLHPSPIILAINNILDCIINNKKPLCTGFDGYKSLELIVASVLSSKKHKPMKLPLKMGNFIISSR